MVAPRTVAVLAVLALLPEAIYAAVTGHLNGVLLAIGATNILLISGSIVVLFGPAPGGNGGEPAHG